MKRNLSLKIQQTQKISNDLSDIGGINGGYSFGNLPMGFYMRTNVDNIVWFNNSFNGNSLNIEDLKRAEINIRKSMMKTFNYFIKMYQAFLKLSYWTLLRKLGTRASRLLNGEHIITKRGTTRRKALYDTVVLTQPPYRNFNPSHPLKEIPYRALLPKKTNNLLIGGRCISGDLPAIEMLRVIPTSTLIGQACGVAAGLSARNDIPVKQLPIIEIKKNLEIKM